MFTPPKLDYLNKRRYNLFAYFMTLFIDFYVYE
nr:MAG TPA: hypothetical protein [Caudoviricetes sp.]